MYFHADFLLGLLFYPEDDIDMFLRNVSLQTTWRYIPEDTGVFLDDSTVSESILLLLYILYISILLH